MIESGELIERWENGERVLIAMPEHDRLKHWNMGTWGEVNECGTIACAAGHCGLDPWFRQRGFKLDFRNGRAEISNVVPFFGLEGSQRIFLNPEDRPVETVIDEMHEYVGELRQIEALMASARLPKIGDKWPEQGGIFAGLRLGLAGAPPYGLIVGPEFEGYSDWNTAMTWASKLAIAGHRDFRLPTRLEQNALFDRVRDLFQPNAYWSGEQHESGSDCAWGQCFDSGGQDDWDEDDKLRARAVRSTPIQ